MMESNMEGRLENLEITVEGIKAEIAVIRLDMQQMMRLMGGGPNDHDGSSEGGSKIGEKRLTYRRLKGWSLTIGLTERNVSLTFRKWRRRTR